MGVTVLGICNSIYKFLGLIPCKRILKRLYTIHHKNPTNFSMFNSKRDGVDILECINIDDTKF